MRLGLSVLAVAGLFLVVAGLFTPSEGGAAAPAASPLAAGASPSILPTASDSLALAAAMAVEDSLARSAAARAEAGEFGPARADYETLAARLEARLQPGEQEVELRIAKINSNIGRTSLFLGDLERSIAAFQKAIEIRTRLLGPDHPDLLQAKSFLGDCYHMAGDYAAALAQYEESLIALRRSETPPLRQIGILLTTIGALQHRQENYAAAESSAREALEILRGDSLSGPGDVAMALSNLSAIRTYVGGPAEGRALAEEALSLYKLVLPEGHPTFALTMGIAAYAAAEQGDYSAARSLWREAITMQERALGPASPDVGHTMLDFATVLVRLGEVDEAEEYYLRARKIFEDMQGPQGPAVIDAIQGLAQVARARQDFARERSLLEEALAAAEVSETPLEFNTSDIVTTLSELSVMEGEATGARSLLERSLEIGEKYLGRNHHQLVPLRQTLARFDLSTAEVENARQELDAIFAAESARLGPDAPSLAPIEADRARALWETGELDGAFASALHAERIGREHLRLSARGLPERPALLYATKRPAGLDLAIEMALQRPALARSVWNELINSRAVVLDVMSARHRANESDPESFRLRQEYQRATSELAQITVRGDSKLRPQLEAARLRTDALEESLATLSLVFRDELAGEDVNLSDVAAELGDKTALIAISRFHKRLSASPFDLSPPESYVAFVLSGREEDPRLVELGPCEEIDATITAWRQALVSNREEDAASAGNQLRQRVWDPMLETLGRSWQSRDMTDQAVFLVPDGALFLVDWYALPTEGDRYLVETGPEVISLTTERDLLEERRASSSDLLLALGGVSFDETPELTLHASRNLAITASVPPRDSFRDRPSAATAQMEPFRGATWSCPSFERVRFLPLPGSKKEVEEIARGWRGKVRKLTGADANEAAFKNLAPGANVIHLATHGFAFSGDCDPTAESEEVSSRGMGGLGWPERTLENPLRLAGLALAGANLRDRVALGEGEDGILTAEEIAALDLSSVQLAVLAACDTGVGGIARGEGVLGLRRAFRYAGAQSLLLSLWPVEDEDTRQWMVKFHHAWRSGKSVSRAARDTSRETLAEQRAGGLPTTPTAWAGFVATGIGR